MWSTLGCRQGKYRAHDDAEDLLWSFTKWWEVWVLSDLYWEEDDDQIVIWKMYVLVTQIQHKKG